MSTGRPDHRHTPPGKLEWTLWLLAAVCLLFVLRTAHAGWAARAEGARIAPESQNQAQQISAQEVEVPDEARPVYTPAHAGEVIARLDIAALHLSVPVVEGDSTGSLLRGAGHLAGTAVPGGLGNLVLAAHRDTFFRPLQGVRPGMVAVVTDSHGHWRYTVDSTEIVTPDRVDLLGIGNVPEMTLVTCYPFHYIGAAPQRFIVHAHLVSAAGDAS